jgi:hypothetical protein
LKFNGTSIRTFWRDTIFALVLVGCAASVVTAGCKTAPHQEQSQQQRQITALVQQLSTLSQSDLIVFADGRVWYVRNVRGGSMEVVGWIGDNARSEDIDSFVLANSDFTIVRKNDPKWAENRDKYFKQ